MQLKGLVKFFGVMFILICLYQLSYTWFVRSFESDLKAKAEKNVASQMQPAKVKYPNDATLQVLYQDSIEKAVTKRYRRLLDSNANTSVTWWGTPYSKAKDNEFKLGLDLQGGMAVTLEVGLEGLIRSLSANSKDPAFNQALAQAAAQKATGGADLITLFSNAYKQKAPNTKLAPLFIANSNKKVTFNSSDDDVIKYLRSEAEVAFDNTKNILQTRIDQFGVASPTINPDKAKNVITIELAGVTDKERVRNYLQSSANLQFFELYNLAEVYNTLQDIQPVVKDYISGAHNDTAYNEKAVIDTFNAKLKDSVYAKNQKPTDVPVFSLMQLMQPQQDDKGQTKFPSEIALVAVKDTAILGEYLRLGFVADNFPPNLKFVYGYAGNDEYKAKGIVGLYALKMPDATGVAFLEGSGISDARQDYTQDGKVCVSMQMNKEGEKKWATMTEKNVGKPIAIVLDEFVRSAPNVNEKISGGSSQISGGFDKNVQEAQDLADILKSGPLSAPAKIVQEQQVGATLGDDAIRGGTMSFAISFLIIFALMLIYYNTSGWVANASLILNLFFTIGTLASFGATLTAAGIAALVLTIGMAVDTNVIIFERIKEELTLGKSYQNAVNTGYRRSLAPVLDSHVTTFLTAAILFYFGLGPVRGFATTQMIGIVLNLFCGILISRLITEWFTDKQKHLNYFTSVSKKVFAHAQYKFIEFRKVAYAISLVVLLAGAGAIFYGFDYGVEFEGGRSYTIQFDKKLNTGEVADALKPSFGNELPIIKTVGSDGNQLNITTAYEIQKTDKNTDSLVERAMYTGLQKYLPAGTSFEKFEIVNKVGSQTVLPTISAELKNGATLATIFSIIIICLYIFIRFRDWRYSLGTIVSLLHDVLVTLAVFSFARKIVPFPLEIDQHFIAAILTVIGFSMNDTIIVFDRIRENSHLMPGVDKGIVINKSINQTLSRTIMTSLTVFLTLLVLFIFGGEVTRGFAFAMLIGVLVGTYSSIFVASPILMDFGKNKPLGADATKADPLTTAKNKVIV